MTPKTPRIIRVLMDLIHRKEFFLRVKSDFKTLHGPRAAPQDAGHSIFDSLTNSPFFDASYHCGLIDRRRLVIARPLRRSLLHRARGELLHLGCRFRVAGNCANLIHPLDTRTTVPAGHDETNRRAMVAREPLAAHFSCAESTPSEGV